MARLSKSTSVQRYLPKIGGLRLDRIDLHIEVPAVPYQELRSRDDTPGSDVMRARVENARALQLSRGFLNSEIPPRVLRQLCPLDDVGERTLETSVRRLDLSARAHSPLSRSPVPSQTLAATTPSRPNASPRPSSTALWTATGTDARQPGNGQATLIPRPMFYIGAWSHSPLLTRLRVQGFKNLVDVDVRFGPFTCIAGANGIGKSNLFDAIFFLSALAEKPLLDAALSVRDEAGRSGDVRSLFHRVGESYADTMSFEAEMIVPLEGTDDLGQQAQATITFLRYTLKLSYRTDEGAHSLGRLEVVHEDLSHIRMGDAHKHILFPHGVGKWRRTAVRGHGTGHRTAPFISTEGSGDSRVIKIHQDGGSSGKPRSLLASSLPRTALSTVNAAEGPTATMARKEMRSWRLLQLEPSRLRRPDPFTAPARLGPDGSHLAATLYRLARSGGDVLEDASYREGRTYVQVANRLSELIDDVRGVFIERDERRELLTLHVTGRDGTIHPARALSDGTLRFLALAILELDPETTGLLCLEEPENGIHPDRIPAMLDLLRDIASDVEEPVGLDNPLRQVIVNTHSPSVVGEADEDDILVADLRECDDGSGRSQRKGLSFRCLPRTWRSDKAKTPVAPPGAFLPYLKPIVFGSHTLSRTKTGQSGSRGAGRRVADRPDLQIAFHFGEETRG